MLKIALRGADILPSETVPPLSAGARKPLRAIILLGGNVMKYEEVKELLSKGFTVEEIRGFMSEESAGDTAGKKLDNNPPDDKSGNPSEGDSNELKSEDDILKAIANLSETVTQLGANVKSIQESALKKTSLDDLNENSTVDKAIEDFIKEL